MKIPTVATMEGCSNCALCDAACPIYLRDKLPGHSPRGILANIQLYHEDILKKADLAKSLGECLICGKCENACPGRLPLDFLFFNAKLEIGQNKSNLLTRLAPRAFLNLLKSVSEILKKDKHVPRFARLKKFRPFIGVKPKKNSANKKILLFPGCSARLQPEISRACVKALQHNDYDVISPLSLACCGRNTSRNFQTFLNDLRHNLGILAQENFEALVTPCPACLRTIQDIWPRSEGLTEAEKDFGQNLAKKSFYIGEYLKKRAAENTQETILWHESCFITEQASIAARSLLKLDQCPVSQTCCGRIHQPHTIRKKPAQDLTESGVAKIFEPERNLSAREEIGKSCRDNMAAFHPDIVVTPCPDCVLALNQKFAAEKDRHRAIHIMVYYARHL